jgi:branched-chain amino acid transport system substrate-binding protein
MISRMKQAAPRWAYFSLIAILAWVGLSGCDGRPADMIRIAVVGPMTGDQSKQGTDLKNGVELAVAEWNAKGGLLGKKVELLVGDDQHDPKQAVSIANKFANSGVVGVVGHWNSSASIPASEVYHRANIPMITPASTNPQVTDRGYANVFRVCGRDDQQGRVAAEFVVTQLKVKRVAVLHDKTTYGQGLADEFKKSLAAIGGDRVEVVYYSGITQGDKDFRGVLTTVASKKPDVYFFGGIYPEGGLLVKQAKEVGLKAPMVSGDGVIDPVFVQIAGAAADGTYLTFSPDTTKLPAAQEVLKNYRARYGEPGPYSFYAYDAAQILLRALQSAGTTDGFGVSQALHTMSYDGITGRIQFDSKGDLLTTQYVVWITKNGTFEEFWRPSGR